MSIEYKIVNDDGHAFILGIRKFTEHFYCGAIDNEAAEVSISILEKDENGLKINCKENRKIIFISDSGRRSLAKKVFSVSKTVDEAYEKIKDYARSHSMIHYHNFICFHTAREDVALQFAVDRYLEIIQHDINLSEYKNRVFPQTSTLMLADSIRKEVEKNFFWEISSQKYIEEEFAILEDLPYLEDE